MAVPGRPSSPVAPLHRLLRRPASALARLGDVFFRLICQFAAVLIVVLAVLLVIVLFYEAWLAIRTIGIRFFLESDWDPEPSHRVFGALAFIYGTVATSLVAMVLAVPLGVATAAFLSEIAPGWLRRPASFLVEMLAAIPSVVYGFWGLYVLAPKLQKVITWLGGPNTGGSGILAAGLVLAIMIVPYVAAVAFDVCQAVPQAQRAGALALGSTRWQMIWRVVLPYARPGIVGGCFLALGRALGETMAVTMLIGNRPEISLSPFAMGDSIASAIANQFTEATYDLYLSALVELGLVLLLVNIVVNALARVLIWRVSRVGKVRGGTGAAPVVGEPSTDGKPAAHGSPPAVRESAPAAPERRPVWTRKNPMARWVNRLMIGVLGLALAVTVGSLFVILGYLLYHGIGALDWDFFTKLPAPVGEKGGGMANALYGSVLLVSLATLFAVPVGLLAAIYLAEYRSDYLGPVVRFIGELLGGVPSIVIGIFAYALVVRPMGHFSGWAGSFALGVMMMPIVMRASEEALKLVPRSIRDASHALGASHHQTVLRITVPAALPSIITAVFLGIARIGGETAPLLLTASSNQYWPTSPNDFTPSLPVFVFTYAVSPYEDWHRQAWAAALVLLALVMVLNVGVRLLTGKRVLQASRAE
jgi:phosphate transport system permease protein